MRGRRAAPASRRGGPVNGGAAAPLLRWLLAASCLLSGPPPAPGEGSASAQQTANDFNNRGVALGKAGQLEEGIALLRQAVQLDPADHVARINLSAMLTDLARDDEGRGQSDRAIAALEEAVTHNPDNGMALATLGDLLYRTRSDLDGALRAWEGAAGKVPAQVWHGVANRIQQAKRDQLIERGFAARQSAHFDIRFQESRDVDVAPLEQVLEASFQRLSEDLGPGPSRVTVMVYTERDLRRTYNQRDWSLGFYDGRIRIRLEDLDQEFLQDLTAHELAHAFLHHLYRGRLPTWVHEGFAQLQERPRRLEGEGAALEQAVIAGTKWVPLKWLDQHFEQPSGTEDLARAYLQAKLVVRALVDRHGLGAFKRFLEQMAAGVEVGHAYESAFAPSRWSRTDQSILP